MEQTYFLEVLPLVEKGAKAKRLGWPEGKYITSAKDAEVKVSGVTKVELASNVLLIDPTKENKKLNRPAGKNLVGYQPNPDERTSMDWVIVEEAPKEETPSTDGTGSQQ